MKLIDWANELCSFLTGVPEVKHCRLYGSLSKGTDDAYSDIDIEVDVSGIDNGAFLVKVPDIIGQKYAVIFTDYAPSLAPEKYIVSVAISTINPFMVVDICCTAVPHVESLSKADIASLNNQFEHTLKLFTANLKHYIRRVECFTDIEKMYGRIWGKKNCTDEYTMLRAVYQWLMDNADNKYTDYLKSIGKYL